MQQCTAETAVVQNTHTTETTSHLHMLRTVNEALVVDSSSSDTAMHMHKLFTQF
jgi:hypothetical protein